MNGRAAITAIAAALIATLVFAAYVAFNPGTGSTFRTSGTFNFSRDLTTRTGSASNPLRCGYNTTEVISFPAGIVEELSYSATVNTSGGEARLWISSPFGPANFTLEFGQGTEGGFGDGGAASTFVFMFQGCGPVSPVFIGLWGSWAPYSNQSSP